MKKLAFLLFLSLAAGSCRVGDLESEPVQITNPDYKPRHQDYLRFKASLDTYKTKTSVDFENNLKQTWDKGDLVLVCDHEAGKEALYEAISGGKDTSTLVRVSGDTLSTGAGKVFTAYYPADFKSGKLSSRLTYTDPSTIGQVPMTATGSVNLNFENSCALVRCSYSPAANMVIKKVTFSSDSSLSSDGNIVMDCTSASPVGITLYKGRTSSFSLFLNPGTYQSFKVALSGDDVSEEITLEYDLELTRNLVAEVDLNLPEGKTINLTKIESANSYVIYSAGEYIFTPTKGCSGEPLTDISSVDVLWEMNNQDTAPTASIFSSIRYSGGKICFTTPETYVPGNALIAAKNKDGNIIWSWHIWACEDQISTLKYDTAGKYLLMDRSLGALSGGVSKPDNNKYASSLLYQWGRKDPFPGQTTQGSRNLIKVTGIAKTVKAGPADIPQTISNPTVFYTGDDNWNKSTEQLWNSSEKTIYDPCPPGYVVPPKEVFSESADIFSQGYATSVSRSGSFVFTSTGNGHYCYPLSGFYKGNDGGRGTVATVYTWTTDLKESTPLLCYMYYASKATHIDPALPMPASTGASIRCMKIIKNN